MTAALAMKDSPSCCVLLDGYEAVDAVDGSYISMLRSCSGPSSIRAQLCSIDISRRIELSVIHVSRNKYVAA